LTANYYVRRQFFKFIWLTLARWTPRFLNSWRIAILRMFGAQIAKGCIVYSDCTIWAPWNLIMHTGACIGPRVEVYNVGYTTLGVGALISQDAYICTASHDFRSPEFQLTFADVVIEERAWVCSRSIILPGVTVAAGSIIGAGCVASRSTEKEMIYAGNPMQVVGQR
jgi:putative colanic acid biosynthesis acetyltransferase WcaF